MENRSITGMLESPYNFLSPRQGHFAKDLDFRNGDRGFSLDSGNFNFEGRKDIGVSSHQNKEMTITTSQGDVVTIEDSSFLEGRAASYNSLGKQDGRLSFFSYKSESVSVGREFVLSVEGDLSKDEIRDIQDLLKEMEGIMSDLKGGGYQGAVDSALDLLGDKQSLSGLDASLSYEEKIFMREETSSVSGASGDNPHDSSRILEFMEKIKERMDSLKEKSSVKPERIESVMEQLLRKMSSREPGGKIAGLLKRIMEDVPAAGAQPENPHKS